MSHALPLRVSMPYALFQDKTGDVAQALLAWLIDHLAHPFLFLTPDEQFQVFYYLEKDGGADYFRHQFSTDPYPDPFQAVNEAEMNYYAMMRKRGCPAPKPFPSEFGEHQLHMNATEDNLQRIRNRS